MTIWILFMILSGPNGEPTIHTQQFNSEQACKQAAQSFMTNSTEGFGDSHGTHWNHSKTAWCSPASIAEDMVGFVPKEQP